MRLTVHNSKKKKKEEREHDRKKRTFENKTAETHQLMKENVR
jgi:hypothetical protein